MLATVESHRLQPSSLTASFHPRSWSLLFACLGLSQKISHAPNYCGLLISFRWAQFTSFLNICMPFVVSGPKIIYVYTALNNYFTGIFLGGNNWVGGIHSRFVSLDLGSRLNLPLFYYASLSESLNSCDLRWEGYCSASLPILMSVGLWLFICLLLYLRSFNILEYKLVVPPDWK